MTTQTIFGIHAVTMRLQSAAESVQLIYLNDQRQDTRIEKIIGLAKQHQIQVNRCSNQQLQQYCHSKKHQGIAAVCDAKAILNEQALDILLQQLQQPALLLILDGITDPHNLGAILRSADAASVDAVITTKDKAVSINPTVSKVACGAAENVPFIQVTNLARTMQHLQNYGIWIYGTDGQAQQSVYQTDLRGSIALVMGAEGKGMRRLTREHCDHLVSLPMQGQVSSLNVSVATGVCLFEIIRQRQLS